MLTFEAQPFQGAIAIVEKLSVRGTSLEGGKTVSK
jgi:hypothetical protein